MQSRSRHGTWFNCSGLKKIILNEVIYITTVHIFLLFKKERKIDGFCREKGMMPVNRIGRANKLVSRYQKTFVAPHSGDGA